MSRGCYWRGLLIARKARKKQNSSKQTRQKARAELIYAYLEGAGNEKGLRCREKEN